MSGSQGKLGAIFPSTMGTISNQLGVADCCCSGPQRGIMRCDCRHLAAECRGALIRHRNRPLSKRRLGENQALSERLGGYRHLQRLGEGGPLVGTPEECHSAVMGGRSGTWSGEDTDMIFHFSA